MTEFNSGMYWQIQGQIIGVYKLEEDKKPQMFFVNYGFVRSKGSYSAIQDLSPLE